MPISDMLGTEYDQMAKDLYELSRHPKFKAFEALLNAVAMRFYAPPPKTKDEAVAFTTFSHAQFFARQILTDLKEETEFGERLLNPSAEGEVSDDAETDRRYRGGQANPWPAERPREPGE